MSQHHRFVGAARLIAALTLVSRVLGLLRETVYSYYFGASPLLSSFRVAFQLPNLARRLFGEGALSSSFIPVFAKCRESEGEACAQRLAGGILTLSVATLTGLLLIAEIALLVTSRYTWGPTLSMTAIMFPYMPLICLTAFFGGVLHCLNRFAAPAFAPVLLNVIVIIAAWSGAEWLGYDGEAHFTLIAWSVVAAGILQLAFQIAWLRGAGFRLHINFDWRSAAVRRVVTLMGPMIVGLSAVQINTFVDTLIALLLVEDGRGPAVLGYSQYLYQLPLGIFGTALATAIFPMLASHRARGDMVNFARSAEYGMRTSLVIAIPASVGLILIARPLVRLLFEHGEFDSADTSRVVASLTLYGLGIWAYSLQHILVRAFYSMEDSKSPVRVAATMVLLNCTLNLILVRPLREAGVSLGTAICATIQTTVLCIMLTRRLGNLRWRPVLSTALRAFVAAGAMGIVVWIFAGSSPMGQVIPGGDLVRVALCVIVGGLVYLGCAVLLRLDELRVLLAIKRSE